MMNIILALTIQATTLAPSTAAAMPIAAADQPKMPVASEALAIAKRIVVKMRIEEQRRFALTKVAPLFAMTALAAPPDQLPDEIRTAIQAPGGRERVAKMLSEEYRLAFEVRLPELTGVIAERLAKDMSIDDLKAVEAFLDSPAGQKWAGELAAVQQASSDAGARAGEAAGREAGIATIRRLRGEGTGT